MIFLNSHLNEALVIEAPRCEMFFNERALIEVSRNYSFL